MTTQTITNVLSPSGARIRGDDYQHLFIWCRVLQALLVENGIAEIGIENPDSGNVDDLVEYYNNGDRKFYQVKSSVDSKQLVNFSWLTSVDKNRRSILQKFHETWKRLTQDGIRPKLELVTNRSIDPHDPVIILRDGRDGVVVTKLRQVKSRSKAGRAKLELLTHLDITEKELFEFLSCLSFKIGKLEEEWKEMAGLQMSSLGLRSDARDVQAGIDLVRSWVTAGKRKLSLEDLRTDVDLLNLKRENPIPVLLIQAIDRDPHPETSTITLDWVGHYLGTEPRTRRTLVNPDLWNSRLRTELREAAKKLRELKSSIVYVRGYMRLPAWFTTGVELGKTAGFNVMTSQQGVIYSSEIKPTEFSLAIGNNRTVGKGDELAMGLSISIDLSSDVIPYVKKFRPEVGRYVCLTPQAGPSNMAIEGAREAFGCAFGIRDMTRNLVKKYRPSKVHLFLAMPSAVSLLLGHLWDRMPATQLYEDQGPGQWYITSFLIAN